MKFISYFDAQEGFEDDEEFKDRALILLSEVDKMSTYTGASAVNGVLNYWTGKPKQGTKLNVYECGEQVNINDYYVTTENPRLFNNAVRDIHESLKFDVKELTNKLKTEGFNIPVFLQAKHLEPLDWNGWLNREQIMLDEALFLSMGELPYDKDKAFFQTIGLDEPEKYTERRKIAESWRESGQLPCKIKREEKDRDYYIKPLGFFRLARDNGWLDLLNPQLDPIHEFLERNETELKAEAFKNKNISNAPKPITPLTGGHYVHKPPMIPQADYETWRKADLWTIERGILLLLNAEALPSLKTSTGRCNSDDEQQLYDKFLKIWAIAESSLAVGTLTKIGKGFSNLLSQVLPGEFISWANSKGYQIPDELKIIGTATQTEAVGNAGVGSDAITEPVSAKVIQNKTPRTRKTNLSRAVDEAIKIFGSKPSFDELWQFFQDDKDRTGFIQDYTDIHIIWIDTKGKLHNTQKETLANHLSRVRS
ncbi:MAG: hypothetical protein PHE96_09215 [Methylococcales bacterium]|nr:hypothetical protein [Methylococcales bacterium]